MGLIPGAAGVVLGLYVMGSARVTTMLRGRLSLAMAGLLLMVCGAWFAIGPSAWPVLYHGEYLVRSASPLRYLAYDVGYALGVGLILAACGGFASGWAWRHRRTAPLTMASSEPAATETPAPVESAI